MEIKKHSWNIAKEKNDDNAKKDQSLAIVLVQLLGMSSRCGWTHHLKKRLAHFLTQFKTIDANP